VILGPFRSVVLWTSVYGSTPPQTPGRSDLIYDPDSPLPRLDCLFHDGLRLAVADGSVRFIRKDIGETTLRAAITRNGGETLGPDW
jgi:hypothetical protein